MSGLAALIQELDALEAIHARMAEVASRDDAQRRYDLVALRRELAQQIAQVDGLADPLFATLADPSITQAYRGKLSHMRSATAMHQADWPAVRLGESPEEHSASAKNVRAANREFIAWMRATIAALPPSGDGAKR